MSRLPNGSFVLYGQRLHLLRERHELSKADLARLLGVTRSHISHMEQASRSRDVPSLRLVMTTAQMLGVSTDWLMREDWPLNEATTSIVREHIRPIAEPQQFGRKLLFLRQRAQLSQATLAKELGAASKSTISNIEAGRRLVSPLFVATTASYFKTTMDWLLDDTQPAEQPASMPASMQHDG